MKRIYSQEQENGGEYFSPFQEQQQQSITILGGSGYQRGVEVVETGGNCESFECRYFPEVNEALQGIGGETFLKARSAKFSRDINLNAEVNAATGIMAYTTTAACAVANDTATYGDGTGTILLDEATESQNRSGWRSVAIRLSSNPNLIVA